MNGEPTKFLAVAAALLLAGPLLWVHSASASTVTTLARLGGNPDGYHPRAALIDGGDGFFYGTSEAGGPPNCGTVFKVAPDGTLTTLYIFTGGGDGANPIGGLVRGSDGNFYGTTSGGGSGTTGTFFKMTAAGALTTLHSFDASTFAGLTKNNEGARPSGTLVQGSDGNFYGTAISGGSEGSGTVFRLSPAGAFTKLVDFDSVGYDYAFPSTALVQGNDGNFYGVLENGGPNGYGSVYQVTPAGALATIYEFTNDSDGELPSGGLVKGSDGNFYGTTMRGGPDDVGTFFRITPGGMLTTLHDFADAAEGMAGSVPLTLGADGNFYGATTLDGPTGLGAVYRLTPAGALTVLAGFTSPDRQEGTDPTGVLLGGDGNLYGATRYSGNGDAGTLFKVAPGGTLTILHPFKAGGFYCKAALAEFPDGNFYGVTQEGGATGAGTIFGVSPDGAIATVHDFNEDTEGKAPGTRLTPDGTGNFYGTCDLEGINGGGCFFAVSLASATSSSARRSSGPVPQILFDGDIAFRIVYDNESPPQGWNDPLIDQLKSPDFAKFIISGELNQGGFEDYNVMPDSDSSAARATTPAGTFSAPVLLYQFTGGADGSGPRGALVIGADGNYYGVTAFGGANGLGTVFRLTPDGVLTTLHAFAGAGDGAVPQAGLVFASDGNFYGTTSGNSYNASTFSTVGNGTIFRVASDGTFTTLHAFADDDTQVNNPAEGSQSLAALLQASDGNLYGVTSAGGYFGDGAVFSITTDGVFAKVGDLAPQGLPGASGENSAFGRTPTAALIQSSDGNLYGTTTRGGTEQDGVVFKVTLGGSTHHPFFNGEADLGSDNYYLALPDGTVFGYYAYLSDPHYIYHYDLGYEYVFDNTDAQDGVYFYDFASSTFFYTSPTFPFPYLYDFSLDSTLYYFPATNPQAPHTYTSDPRYFFDYATGQIITK